MNTPEPKVGELIQCIRWHTPHGAKFWHGSRINIQEVLACVFGGAAAGVRGSARFAGRFHLDSRVAIKGLFRKGGLRQEVYTMLFLNCFVCS